MGDFFNVDNKFFQGLGKIIDVICLSAFWFFLCIPIVTAGAATTALYYTVNKVIRNNRSYIGREFWHAFKTNFRQSTIVWLILLLLYAIMGFDCYVMYQYAKAGVALGKIYIVFAVLMMFATMWAIICCLLISFWNRFFRNICLRKTQKQRRNGTWNISTENCDHTNVIIY